MSFLSRLILSSTLAISLLCSTSCFARPPSYAAQQPLTQPYAPTNLSAFHSAYHSLGEIEGYMRQLQAVHPERVQIVELGHSAEGREMYALRIGTEDEDEEVVAERREGGVQGKAGFVISGPQHAREWIGTATALYLTETLLANASESVSLSELLDAFTFYIIPTPNPDGYAYTWDPDGDRFWYKNRQVTEPDQDPACVGIDMNRNWGYKWKKSAPNIPIFTAPDLAGDDTSPSPQCRAQKKSKAKKPPASPCSQWYPGHRPFEAPETNNLANFVARLPRVRAFLELRSYGQMLSVPYAYSCKKSPLPSEDQLEAAIGAIQAAQKRHGTVFTTGRLCETLYPAHGNVLDYMHATLGIKFVFAAHLRDTGTYGFSLPEEWIMPVGEETADMVDYIARFASGGVY